MNIHSIDSHGNLLTYVRLESRFTRSASRGLIKDVEIDALLARENPLDRKGGKKIDTLVQYLLYQERIAGALRSEKISLREFESFLDKVNPFYFERPAAAKAPKAKKIAEKAILVFQKKMAVAGTSKYPEDRVRILEMFTESSRAVTFSRINPILKDLAANVFESNVPNSSLSSSCVSRPARDHEVLGMLGEKPIVSFCYVHDCLLKQCSGQEGFLGTKDCANVFFVRFKTEIGREVFGCLTVMWFHDGWNVSLKEIDPNPMKSEARFGDDLYYAETV